MIHLINGIAYSRTDINVETQICAYMRFTLSHLPLVLLLRFVWFDISFINHHYIGILVLYTLDRFLRFL